MKLVVISDGHPREWPILMDLKKAFPNFYMVKPIYLHSDSSSSPRSLAERLSSLYRRIRDGVRRRMIKQKLGLLTLKADRITELPSNNLKDSLLPLLEKLQPDVLVTCRAPILDFSVIQKARWCGLNIHFGIVPGYRGNDGLFWALMQQDFNSLGGSIHLLDPGVDTGAVIANAFPELDGSETMIELELKVSSVLSEALLECLKKLELHKKSPEGRPQTRSGRNYRSRERTFSKDLACCFKRLIGRHPVQKKQIKYYF